jgi:hypothetical protein
MARSAFGRANIIGLAVAHRGWSVGNLDLQAAIWKEQVVLKDNRRLAHL